MGKIKKLSTLRRVVGISLLCGFVVAPFAWVLVKYPKYFGVGVIIVVGLILAVAKRFRTERERTKKLIDAAFRDAYSQLSPQPSIVTLFRNGYPAFEIKFRSKLEMEAAESRNDSFKAQIGRLFKDYGPRSRPFNADMAILFCYDGYLEEMRARYKPA